MAAKEVEEIFRSIIKAFDLQEFRACDSCQIRSECEDGDLCYVLSVRDESGDCEELFAGVFVRGRQVMISAMELKEEIKNDKRRVRKSG